jgi:hypothetical protein
VDITWTAGTSTTYSSTEGTYSLDPFLGVSGTYHFEAGGGPNSGPPLPDVSSGNITIIGVIPFPPGMNNKPYLEVLKRDATTYEISDSYVDTPYGKFTVSDTSANVGDDKFFKPWLHVSNGNHCVQGFQIGDKTYLYYDGQDMTDMIDIDINNIQTIIMDIPWKRVLELS